MNNDLLHNEKNKVEQVVLSIEENINKIENSKNPSLDVELDFEDLDEENNDDSDELKEVNINTNLENTLESIQL